MPDYILCHHGIRGQKWGIRRFQNEDGSLTEAGKKRYLDSRGNFTFSGARKYDRDIRKQTTSNMKYIAKNANQLSDSELSGYITRLQQERQLKSLVSDSRSSEGLKFLKKVGEDTASEIISTAVKGAAAYGIDMLGKQLGSKATFSKYLKEAVTNNVTGEAAVKQAQKKSEETGAILGRALATGRPYKK